MPKELEFMKSAGEKEMSDDEYKALRGGYDAQAADIADRVKKILTAFLVAFLISFVLLHIVGLLNSDTNYGGGMGNYTWLAAEFLLAVFLYGLKPEDGRQDKYETDKKILLKHAKNKIKSYKIRLGLVIALGAAFAALNIICWWFAYMFLTMPSAITGSSLSIASIAKTYLCTFV